MQSKNAAKSESKSDSITISSVLNPNPHRRIDIRFIPYDSYACAVLYFTGSDQFNVRMRQRALELGLTLNEYALKEVATDRIINTETEADVFKALDWDYIEPQNRQ